MAAKKGGAVALQQDVASDEEWEVLLRRTGLLLVDVYSEWCGPCVGMLANLKKIKVELGGDLLVLATAKSDTIEALQRHRNHSEPVWMLISGGRLINLVFGADAPRIARLIATELDYEVKKGEECARHYMSWDELTPEEEARLQRAEQKRLQALQEEEERRARAQHQQRVDNYTKLALKLNRYSVVLLLPHAVPPAGAGEPDGDADPGVLAPLREAWAALGLEERRRQSLNVSADMANDVFFERKLPQHEELIKAMASGPCLAILLHKPPTEVEVFPEVDDGDAEGAEGAEGEEPAPAASPEAEGDSPGGEDAPAVDPDAPATAAQPQPQRVLVEPELGEIEALAAQSLYGFYPAQEATSGQPPQPAQPPQPPQQQEDQQPQPAAPQDPQDSGDADQWTRFQPAADSPAAACLRSGSGPALPGLWTPLTPIAKAATMQTLFPDDTDLLTRPPPPPSLLPPSLVHVFPSARSKDVMVAAAMHDGAVTGSGFFSEQREPLAVDEAEFEALQREKQDTDVFVVAVSVEAVAANEALAALQPLAVSASPEEGLADCDAYFPGPAPEEEDEEDLDDANLLG